MVAAGKCKIPAGAYSAMTDYPEDVYTEPSDVDVHTLRNLGPLTGLAGVWEGTRSLDVNPKAEGPEEQVFVERIELQPIDPQTNGPQLFYGLRYHTHTVKPGEIERPTMTRSAIGSGSRPRATSSRPWRRWWHRSQNRHDLQHRR